MARVVILKSAIKAVYTKVGRLKIREKWKDRFLQPKKKNAPVRAAISDKGKPD